MPRPKCRRRVGYEPATSYFKPQGIPLKDLDEVHLPLDELEALRLADLQGLHQRLAAERMGVSRATFGRILAEARAKVARALIQGNAIRIEGGPVAQTPLPHGDGPVRFAVAVDAEGHVALHFGRSEVFQVHALDHGNDVVTEERPNPNRGRARGPGDCLDDEAPPCGSNWLLDTLGDCDAVVARGMGARAFNKLRDAGVRVVILRQDATPEEAAALFAEGKL